MRDVGRGEAAGGRSSAKDSPGSLRPAERRQEWDTTLIEEMKAVFLENGWDGKTSFELDTTEHIERAAGRLRVPETTLHAYVAERRTLEPPPSP